MSDTMLLGILRMPFDLALSTPIAQIQYYQRGVQAADEIEKLRAELDRTHKQLNAAVTLLAEWCHAVDGGASWDYWDNHYKEARWGKGILRSLIDAEIAKLEPLEGEP